MISRDEDSSQSLTLNDSTVIVSEDHVKVLGVVIDSKLNFSLHASAICNKASRQLNALARISNYLDVSARRTIYDCFVASNGQVRLGGSVRNFFSLRTILNSTGHCKLPR